MNEIARALGFNLLSSLAARLPARVGAVVQLGLILIGSLLPLWPLSRGWIQLQDLLAYSSLWLAMSVAGTLTRLRTLAAQTDTTRFFALHYAIMIGILSLVCGIWSVILLALTGPSGGWIALLPMALAQSGGRGTGPPTASSRTSRTSAVTGGSQESSTTRARSSPLIPRITSAVRAWTAS